MATMRSLFFRLLLAILLPWRAVSEKAQHPIELMARALLGGSIDLPDNSQQDIAPKEIRVIGAALPRTGTMSLVEAMERLGLKPYHLKDIIIENGHLELWHDFAVQQATGSFDSIWNLVAQQGYQATMDAPACNHVKELLHRYPNAKVVFTKRDPKKWKASMETAIYPLIQIYDLIPFCWVGKMKMLRASISAFLKDYGAMDPVTRLPDPEMLPAYYEQYAAEIRRIVPKEQLLIFEPRDGYQALCDFLAPGYNDTDGDGDDDDDDVVSNNCRHVLEKKEPYPHANDKLAIKLLVFLMRLVSIITLASPLWIAVWIWKHRTAQTTNSLKSNKAKQG